MKSDVWQNGIYALIIAVVAAVCLWLSPKPANMPHGILLPSDKITAAIAPSEVKLYSNFPSQYKVVGQIRTALHIDNNLDQAAIDNNAKTSYLYARDLAAKAGANGVVITTIGTTNEEGPLNALILYATAISTN